MKILYIGRFVLPDKDATANRVVSNAKLLRSIGHEVELAGWSDDVRKDEQWVECSHFGFVCYEKYKEKNSSDKMRTFINAKPEIELLKKTKYDIVIAYNFPAVALRKLNKYCAKHRIKCIGDVTEWYTNSNKNPLFSIVRAYDSFLRMRVLHKKMDGLIVISKYLQDYYKKQKTVLIPPLIDITDEKWTKGSKSDEETVKFIYAGWPSKKKERLDLIVDAICSLRKKYNIRLDIYGITSQRYAEIYDVDELNEKDIVFHGRVSHTEAVTALKNADFSLIIRDSSRKNNAGFPSKLAESVGCGTPVLVTDISNVKDFVGNGNNGFIVSQDNLKNDIEFAIKHRTDLKVDANTFDYNGYAKQMIEFLSEL